MHDEQDRADEFYAPPAADLGSGLPGAPADGGRAERIRQEHISTEASIKALGCLYLLGAIFIIPAGILMVVGTLADQGSGGGQVEGGVAVVAGIALVYLLIGCVQLATGLGLRRLQPWARIVAALFSAIGLLGFPIGTIISGYILYLLLGAKGGMVFSEPYKQVIEQTPHVKYKTSPIVWGFLILLVLILGAAAVAANLE